MAQPACSTRRWAAALALSKEAATAATGVVERVLPWQAARSNVCYVVRSRVRELLDGAGSWHSFRSPGRAGLRQTFRP